MYPPPPRLAATLLAVLALLTLFPSLPAQADAGSETVLHLPFIAAPASNEPPAAGLEPVLLAALERMAATDPARFDQLALASVRVSGTSAVAVAQAQSSPLPAEIVLLASHHDPAEWRILATSEDPASEFNAGLDAMPAALLDEGDKAFLRRPDPPQDGLSGVTSAAFWDHYLPWPGSQIGYLMQKDGSGHESQLDFDILGNAASGNVYASKPGVVVFVKQSSAGGCPSLLCWQQTNMVVVQHDTGEYSWYVHLAPNSVPVRPGDRVAYGAKIGVEGDTGYAFGIHLHYMVSTGHTAWTPPEDPSRAPWALDIQHVNFGEAAWDQLAPGQRYTSQNGVGEPCNGPSPAPEQVALYEHANFCGAYTLLAIGAYPNPAALAFANDRASSVRIGSDVAAVLCRDDDFGGVCETFAADAADLTGSSVGNDRVSSVQVTPRTQPAPPNTPTLQRPAAGELITGTTVSLAWSAEPSAVAYALQIAATSAFTLPVTDLLTASAAASVGPLPEDAYFWRVRAQNAAGLWSEWSRVQGSPAFGLGFFVVDAAPYRSPHPDLPAYNALRNTPAVRFSWLDSELNAQYRLQVFAATDGVSPPGLPIVDDLTAGLSHTPAPLADGAYVWRVCRLQAGKPAPLCSELRRLDIDTTPPQPPSPAYPDGVTIHDRTRAFAWLPAADAVEYHLQVFVGSGPGVQAASITASQTLPPFIDIRTALTAHTPDRLPDGRYGWRVRGRDTAGNWSAWSEPRTLNMVTPTSWAIYLPALSAAQPS